MKKNNGMRLRRRSLRPLREVIGGTLPSPAAMKLLRWALQVDPPKTLTGLELAYGLVRATRWLHLSGWKLYLPQVQLRATALEGTLFRFLEGADFTASSLTEVRLLGMLDSVRFDRATLRETSFLGCALRGASFRGTRLEDVTFAASQAAWCSFEGAQISYCTFIDVRFREGSFAGAELRDVIFERCDFAGADLSATICENVDFIECSRLDAKFPRTEKRALGAVPRSLAGPRSSAGDMAAMRARYAQAPTMSAPPFRYRLENLARFLPFAFGPEFRAFREKARDPDFPLPSLVARSRILSVAQILLGLPTFRGGELGIGRLVYWLLKPVFLKDHPSFEGQALPEVVAVDGNRALAKYVDLGERSCIVLSVGMEVASVRLARYCVAWIAPASVRYMEDPPASLDPAGIRAALVDGLREFVRSGGEVGDVGRIQVDNLRDGQVQALTQILMAFVLAHELAHFLQAQEGRRDGMSSEDIELDADLMAAMTLRDQEDLDGVAAILRASGFSAGDGPAAAIAATILITGGAAGHLRGEALEARVQTVVGTVFGEEAAVELEREMADPSSILSLLREVFARGASPAS